MLYVFMVSSSTMKKFDMNLALKNVIELKTAIAKSLMLPVEDQVLLCSGGEELKPQCRVGNYGAGTDTNPIFLFSKSLNETEIPSAGYVRASSGQNIENDVEGCVNMAPSCEAVTVRCNLAQRFSELAVTGRKECDDLVHGQHLQQQGWAAVMANLDDAKESLLKHKDHFDEMFYKYLDNCPSYQETLNKFPRDIELLSKVPLLQKLVLGTEQADELNEETQHTLLSWFCSEPRPVLESLADRCLRCLEELNQTSLIAVNNELCDILTKVDNPLVKGVRGIEERLFQLNKCIEDAKRIEKDQQDLGNWFTHTLNRINKDPSVLPDLCGTFQSQLELMLHNHKCLMDILDRCTKAKAELCSTINKRLQFICQVESQMYALQIRLTFLEKHVKSVINQIESFQQVHVAPERYMKMLAEVYRRKSFSNNFMKWATELSARARVMYVKEVSIRDSFSCEESKNIVDGLFPGMEDVPPSFAIECPQAFDQLLPDIKLEDLELLKRDFPELANFCEVPPLEQMPYISQKSAESDSAFSSNVPSSRAVGDIAASSGGSLQPYKDESHQSLAHKSFVLSPGDCASLPNELCSLTSSPFEDCLLPSSELETPIRTKSPFEKNENSACLVDPKGSREKLSTPKMGTITIDSDGDEFESVDQYETACPTNVEWNCYNTKQTSQPVSFSVIVVTKNQGEETAISKTHSDGDAMSPVVERLKSSDSQDSQPTDYFIDDSMPSSYTESNGTSPYIRGNQMKSHHVVVAELQRQVEEKNGALTSALSSLKMSRSNILKLHATMSTLQRIIEEVRGSLRSDVSNLKTIVKEEFVMKMTEIAQIVEKINDAMADVQRQIQCEKDQAIREAKIETDYLESNYLHQLEVESLKLNDAENQIVHYEDRLREETIRNKNLSCEKEQMEGTLGLMEGKLSSMEGKLSSMEEKLKRLMLEHEVELDSVRAKMMKELQEKDDEIIKVKEMVCTENDMFEKSLKAKLQDELECLVKKHEHQMKEKEESFSCSLEEQKQLHKQELQCLQEKLDLANADYREIVDNFKHQVTQELNKEHEEKIKLSRALEEQSEKLSKEVKELEKKREKDMKELEEALTAQHKSELDSLRSRYKLAYSTSSMERLPSDSSLENICLEKEVIDISQHETIISEIREKYEEDKAKSLKQMLEVQEEKLNDTIAEIIATESIKYEDEKNEVILKLQRDHEDQLERLKSRYTVENQVSFNEAINRVAKEKDAIMEELRYKFAVLIAKQQKVKSLFGKYTSLLPMSEHETGEAMLSQSDSGASSSYKVLHDVEVSRFLAELKREIEQHPLITDYFEASLSSGSRDQLIIELEKRLKIKAEEHEQLVSKFMKLAQYAGTHSAKPFCPECKDKVSLLSCNVDDLVLLCYEEKHENFAVFYFGQYLHFLHTDSLQMLDLKIPPGPSGKSWALGVVTDKEFCITKKPTNRYKVSLGTRFYRVKVQSWDREMALTLQRTRRKSQAGSSLSISPSESRVLPVHSPPPEEEGAQGPSHMSASAI